MAYGCQAWLEIDAIGSHEKMKLCIKLVFGTVLLSLSCLNKYQEGKEVLHDYII